MEHLGKALGVAGMLAMQEMNNNLANMVQEKVKPEPVKNWDDILFKTRLN
jgi:hypothetical protein